MQEIITRDYQSPLGKLVIGSYGDQLCLCDWKYRKMRHSIDQRILQGLNASFKDGDSPPIQDCIRQLDEYFQSTRKEFILPILPVGTDFQKDVWNHLIQVPWGSLVSYGQLAQQMGKPDAVRAVAAANGANALSIIIPCHRVIASDGSLTGYAGGLRAKTYLLNLESEKPEQYGLFDQKQVK